jgi:hypothetical protein
LAVASRLGRRYLGVELSPATADLARQALGQVNVADLVAKPADRK